MELWRRKMYTKYDKERNNNVESNNDKTVNYQTKTGEEFKNTSGNTKNNQCKNAKCVLIHC